MRYIKTKELHPGMILAATIYDNNESIMLRSNKKLTSFYINRIRKLDFEGVYIYENDQNVDYKEILSEETRLQAIKSLKYLNIDDCIFVANHIVEELRESKEILIEMINLSSYDNYTYTHSINVSILSVILGIGCGMTNAELKTLSQAALLHDIGKTQIPDSILNKPDKLTAGEYRIMQTHPYLGYKILADNPNISSIVRNAVYSHHENVDGSGYPRHLTKNKIHIMAKIIHIADVYDALTAKRVYKEAMNPADALEYLMSHIDTMFDQELVRIFMRYVALYHVGTTVKLSTGESATIVKNHRSLLTRPIIRTQSGYIIDLKEHLDITIVKKETVKQL